MADFNDFATINLYNYIKFIEIKIQFKNTKDAIIGRTILESQLKMIMIKIKQKL